MSDQKNDKNQRTCNSCKKLEIIKNVQNFFVIMQTDLLDDAENCVQNMDGNLFWMKAETCKRLKEKCNTINAYIPTFYERAFCAHNLIRDEYCEDMLLDMDCHFVNKICIFRLLHLK